MSANIYWEPVSSKENRLRVMAPSSFMQVLERADMALPHTFTKLDIPVLHGMAATMNDEDNPFNELIEAIQDFGSVSVWYEH
jgi:hypothetical protein